MYFDKGKAMMAGLLLELLRLVTIKIKLVFFIEQNLEE